MAPHHQAYFYAIGASVVFSAASLLYAHFSKKISALWMTFFKAAVCFLGMLITVIVMNAWQPLGAPYIAALMLSGLLGLGIGDLFLLQAYARMGAARTLVLYGFQPLFLGVASYYLFHQDFNGYRLVAILFFMICLFLFSLEKFKEHGHWEVVGLIAALLGVLFDNIGVILTRWTFESVPELQPLYANLVRCAGALLFVMVASPWLKVGLVRNFRTLTGRDQWWATAAALTGAYLSLILYLTAIRIGHLASLAALGVFGPLFSTSLECIFERRWPSAYLWLALLSFLIGFTMILSF